MKRTEDNEEFEIKPGLLVYHKDFPTLLRVIVARDEGPSSMPGWWIVFGVNIGGLRQNGSFWIQMCGAEEIHSMYRPA